MDLRQAVTHYSSRAGKNALLIQGAGGNISWKENSILWIKASGQWLSEAENSDIFVPLCLFKLRQLIEADSPNFTLACVSSSTLRPSIETSLHALLPHRIVLHVHAVDVITKAVVSDSKAQLTKCLAGLDWLWVDYVTPGLQLTKAVAALIKKHVAPDIIVLGNHGLIIAGRTIKEVDNLLQDVLLRCTTNPRLFIPPCEKKVHALGEEWKNTDYLLPKDTSMHALGIDSTCFAIAQHKWAMYPDHAIFLGMSAEIKMKEQTVDEVISQITGNSPFIIVENQGTVVNKHITRGQKVMLRCFLDVALRLNNFANVVALKKNEIEKLLNWDAEKYRQDMKAPAASSGVS